MQEPPKASRPLPDLMRSLQAPDEIAPVNWQLFTRKAGEIIARALTALRERRKGKCNERAKNV
jgi:hypothetical protein